MMISLSAVFIALAVALLLLALAFGLYLLLRSLGGERAAADARTPPRPAWADFFSLGEWEAFIREVRRYFDAKGVPYQMDANAVSVGANQYGLSNLAQMCRQLKRAEWGAFVQTHFHNLELSEQERHDLDLKVGDFRQVRDLLMVRLAADDYFPKDVPIISRTDLPGTISYLAFDLPTTVRNVNADEAAVWGISDEELFTIALENVRRNAEPSVTRQELHPGQDAFVFSGESFFIATHALLLEDYPECLGTGGTLVAVPQRHCMIAYPINSLDVVQVVDKLAIVAMAMEREGPGSISPRLYWYQDGCFTDLPFTFTNKAFQFSPPEEFVAMLNKLSDSSAV